MKYWKKLPAKLRNHLVSAMVTFWTSFALVFFTQLSDIEDFNLDLIHAIIFAATLAGIRAFSREVVHNLTKS